MTKKTTTAAPMTEGTTYCFNDELVASTNNDGVGVAILELISTSEGIGVAIVCVGAGVSVFSESVVGKVVFVDGGIVVEIGRIVTGVVVNGADVGAFVGALVGALVGANVVGTAVAGGAVVIIGAAVVGAFVGGAVVEPEPSPRRPRFRVAIV
ncbi:hypothetical protein THRCLA_20177 [Thraustotheca clavata]|uniref:Uncharacterized protein n=1 Tax=Thraustotheca clavata TaxID=74557 RepID=A0A1W0AAX2_9STRA|nr:hypothetical protein THRCLA_20177 [Thraustotheca clavata]